MFSMKFHCLVKEHLPPNFDSVSFKVSRFTPNAHPEVSFVWLIEDTCGASNSEVRNIVLYFAIDFQIRRWTNLAVLTGYTKLTSW